MGKSLACVILQKKYETAVTATEGRVIIWTRELKSVPYHELKCRTDKSMEMEVFHSEDEFISEIRSQSCG